MKLIIFTCFCSLNCYFVSLVQEAYYMQALPLALPWCMAHHFNTRLHGLACVLRLWEQCQAIQLLTVMQKFDLVQHCLKFTQENRWELDHFSAYKEIRDVYEAFNGWPGSWWNHHNRSIIFSKVPGQLWKWMSQHYIKEEI